MLNCSHHFLLELLIVMVPFFPLPAQAWGPKDHQIVAVIAEAHLNASTREKIKTILQKKETLAERRHLARRG
jgi:hypothetical protein